MDYLSILTRASRRLVLEYARRTDDVTMAAALAVIRSDRSSRALAPVGVIGGIMSQRYRDHYHRDDVDSIDELVERKMTIRADVERDHGETIAAIQEALSESV